MDLDASLLLVRWLVAPPSTNALHIWIYFTEQRFNINLMEKSSLNEENSVFKWTDIQKVRRWNSNVAQVVENNKNTSKKLMVSRIIFLTYNVDY